MKDGEDCFPKCVDLFVLFLLGMFKFWPKKTKEEITLKTIRLRHGFSVADVAMLVNVSKKHIASIERGSEDTTLSVVRKLCSLFNVDVNTMSRALENQNEKEIRWRTLL